MSARLFSIALDTDTPPREKLIISKMVDMCDDDGKRIFLAVSTLARAGSCSERHVQRSLRQFCAIGLLRIVREGGKGQGSSTRYEMDVSLLERLRQPGHYDALVAESLRVPANEDEDGAGYAPGACDDASEEADSAHSKGDTQSPLGPSRVTATTSRVTAGVTQPLIDPLSSEREGASASAGEQPGQADAPDAGLTTLDAFRKRWPTTLADDNVKVENAWAALPFDERKAALAGIAGFLAGLKGLGRGKVPAGSTYLAQRKWLDVPAMAAERAGTATVTIAGWSRDWWLLLLDRIFAGRNPSFWVAQAEQHKPLSASGVDIAAAGKRIGELHAYRCDGPEMEAWRPWLTARGARIPPFKGEFRVFLPGPTPPGGKREAGDDDIRF